LTRWRRPLPSPEQIHAAAPLPGTRSWSLPLLAVCVLLAALLSLAVGVIDLSRLLQAPTSLSTGELELLWISRVPRTLALVFAGASTAVAGLILQILLRNRYIEPSMAGTVEGACLGMLLVLLLMPDMPVLVRLLVATASGLAVTAVFFAILQRLPLRSVTVVPLIGMVLSGIVDAVTTFLAHQFDRLQSLAAWRMGDFSQVLAGRWELLWLAFALTIAAAITADRFTIAGLGRDTARSLGLNHRRVVGWGLLMVSAVSASVVVTVGIIPFLGLVVPNAMSLWVGDNLRRTVPLVALAGAVAALLCDMVGRLVRWPYEIPIGVVIGVVGSIAFLWLLSRERGRGG
jgi:iron complex transport system permease protein